MKAIALLDTMLWYQSSMLESARLLMRLSAGLSFEHLMKAIGHLLNHALSHALSQALSQLLSEAKVPGYPISLVRIINSGFT